MPRSHNKQNNSNRQPNGRTHSNIGSNQMYNSTHRPILVENQPTSNSTLRIQTTHVHTNKPIYFATPIQTIPTGSSASHTMSQIESPGSPISISYTMSPILNFNLPFDFSYYSPIQGPQTPVGQKQPSQFTL
eukprot:816596_1